MAFEQKENVLPAIQQESAREKKEHVISEAYRKIRRTANELLLVSNELQDCMLKRDSTTTKDVIQLMLPDQSDVDSESPLEKHDTSLHDQNALLLPGTENIIRGQTSSGQQKTEHDTEIFILRDAKNTLQKTVIHQAIGLKIEGRTLRSKVEEVKRMNTYKTQLEKSLQKYMSIMKENGKLQRELTAARSREIFEKPPEVILQTCKNNEVVLSRELDTVIKELNKTEEDLKKLNIELSQRTSPAEKLRLQLQLRHKQDEIGQLKKHKEVMKKRIDTLQQTVQILEQSSPLHDDSNEQSVNLKKLIEEEARLKLESDLIQERLLSGESLHYATVGSMTMTITADKQDDLQHENSNREPIPEYLSEDARQKQRVYMEQMIMECIREEMSILPNRDTIEQTKANRLQLLEYALSSNEYKDAFMSGLIIFLERMLKEKEDATGYFAIPWIARNAAPSTCTYRECNDSEKVKSGVKEILEEMFIFLDTNCNMELMTSTDQWKRDFWLRCINSSCVLSLRYTDIQKSITKGNKMTESTAQITEHHFKQRFPFSWVIIQMVDDCFRENFLEFEGIATILTSGTIGRLLTHLATHLCGQSEFASETTSPFKEALNDYIHDFVHIIYHAEGEAELKIVCQTVFFSTLKLCYANGKTSNLIRHIVCVRFAYEEMSRRLEYFRTLTQVWPYWCNNINIETEIHLDQSTFNELEFVYSTLCRLIKYLQPTSADMQDKDKQSKWLQKVLHFRPVVEHGLRLQLEYCSSKVDSIKTTNSMWSRLMVFKMFLQHIVLPEPNYIDTLLLLSILCNDVDLKQINTFLAVEQIFIHVFCSKRTLNETSGLANDKQPKYQTRCNAFVLDIVAQLCFAGGEPPEEEVLDRLLSYVTCTSEDTTLHTKNATMFETGVDPNPAFRSLLLRLMMKSSKEVYVSEYLRRFWEETRSANAASNEDTTTIYLLYVQVKEDLYLNYLKHHCVSISDSVCNTLEINTGIINQTSKPNEELQAIATTKAAFEIVAHTLERCASNNADIQKLSPGDRKIVQSLERFFENTTNNLPKVYLAKLLCRRYGTDLYHTLSRSALKWLAIEGTDNDKVQLVDRYIICGEVYRRVREEVARTVLEGGDVKILNDLLQDYHKDGEPIEIFLQLAIHREISCSNLVTRGKGIQQVKRFLKDVVILQDKDEYFKLLENKLNPGFLNITTGTDLKQNGLQCLLVHFYVVLTKLKEEKPTLLHLLNMLKNGDPAIQNMLLPTMPQDDIKAVYNEHGWGGCPNGHPYVIENSGRPFSVGVCADCGKSIGGRLHELEPGNSVYTQEDSTKTGHVLGTSMKSGVIPPERDLNPAYCTAVRLFLHMAMYFGPTKQISAIIKPAITETHVPDFLLDHIRSNIDDLTRVLRSSVDDVLLLIHIAIHAMMRKSDTRLPQSVAFLSSKADRRAWEKEFSSQILKDVLGNTFVLLRKWNNRIATDKRLGADPLMRLIHETDHSQDIEEPNQPSQIRRIWRYRTPITIQHMRHAFELCSHERLNNPVLQGFMNKDDVLQALRYVPNILRLQRALLQNYQKKLDKTEAKQIKVKDLKTNCTAGHETERWIHDFSSAWGIIKKYLQQYACPTKFGRMKVPNDFCNQTVHNNTPLSMLLPTTNGDGLCSYAMLDFIFRTQNDFLAKYSWKSGRDDIRHPTIKPMAVTAEHLICYDHENDLLPLVMANCHFSLEMGEGDEIEYDFAGIERQLMDRLLDSKAMIEIHPYLEIDQMIYRPEVTNQAVFMKVSEQISQIRLDVAMRKQICEECRGLPVVCRSLDNLDIAISILKTTGGQPDAKLATFMVETLQIENAICSQTARRTCELRHVRALWLLLSFQKSKLLIEHHQSTEEVFETFQEDMYEHLDDRMTESFNDYMNNLSIGDLNSVLEIMHEFLLLHVAIRQNSDDSDYIDTSMYSLTDGMQSYFSVIEPPLGLDNTILERFPSEILYKHGVKAWDLAYRTLIKKLGNKRRY